MGLNDVPESIVCRVCEWLDARRSMRSARAVNKQCMAAVESCGRDLVRGLGFDGGLRELVELELRAFDFDGFSDDGFVPKARSGAWLEWGSGVFECSRRRSFEFRLYASMRTKPSLARRRLDVERITTGVAFGARAAARLFGDRALSAAVVCCPGARATRSVMQHANFFGPAQRWVPLHSLVEDLDIITDYTLRNANLDEGVAVAAVAFDHPAPRVLSTVPCRLRGYRAPADTALLLTHEQFAKLHGVVGAERFATLFDIPSDMSIYMGGHGTTPAVILVTLGGDQEEMTDAVSFFWPRQPLTWGA